MIVRTYLERGLPVVVLVRWGRSGAKPAAPIDKLDGSAGGRRRGPHNVLIRREDGTRVVRPFRRLRRSTDANDTSGTR